MCGIAGIYNFDQSKIDPEITNSIKDSLEHRGPDFSKIEYIDNKVVLIHTRLAIIDLDQERLLQGLNVNIFRRWAFEVTEPHIFEYYTTNMTELITNSGFNNIQSNINDPLNRVWLGTK